MVSVHDALSQCSNITLLDLRVTLRGCSGWPDRWNFPFSYNGGETYPRLKKLKLDGYRFGSVEKAPWQMPFLGRYSGSYGLFGWFRKGYWRPWLQEQLYGPSEPVKTNLDLWLDAMDWSGIEELAIDQYTEEVVTKLPSRLTSLRRLESKNTSFIEALPNNTLTHLTWIGPSNKYDLVKILTRQGASLEKLEFRCNEISCHYFRNQLNVSIIPEMAVNLRYVVIDIPRNGTWPFEAFQILSSLPKLRSLEIYSNLQSDCQRKEPGDSTSANCNGEDQFAKPLLNEVEAEDLFRFIRKANIGGQLQNVTFRLGDWTPRWDGPLYFPPWIKNKKVEIACLTRDSAQRKNCKVVIAHGYWPPTLHSWETYMWDLSQVELDSMEDY